MLDINFNQIVELIERRKNNAYKKVNEEMILLWKVFVWINRK